MSRAGARDHDDLMVLARRGALREAEQRELSRLLAADPALAFAQRAGMECDRLAQAELGDEQLIERVTAAALQRLSLPSAERAAPPRWRVPGFGASTLSIGVLALLGYALVSVLGARGKPEPAPRRDVKVEQPQRAAEGPPPPPTAAAAVGVAPTPEPPVRAQMPSAAELFRRSNQARRRGELASAEAGYRRMIQSYPHAEESRLAQLSLAKLLLARKASQEAEAILRRSVARGAGQLEEEALVLHASSLRTLGRPSAEAAVWRRLLEVFPVSAYAAQARERLAELARGRMSQLGHDVSLCAAGLVAAATRWLGSALACGLALASVASSVVRADDARVTLLGAAGTEPLLVGLIEESLRARAFAAPVERGSHASCEAWSRATAADPRVLLCIAFDGTRRAVVFVVGPEQRSPRTRELALAHGLDELGRETIAHVVELALASRAIHVSPPMAADVEEERVPDSGLVSQPTAAAPAHASETPVREPTAAPERAPVQTRVASAQSQNAETGTSPAARGPEAQRPIVSVSDYAIDARAAMGYAGSMLGVRWSAGVELARTFHRTGLLAQRARLGFEYGMPAQLHAGLATAQLQASSLRAGADWVLQTGEMQSVALGLSASLELVQLSRLRASADWQAAQSQRLWTSSLRAELRYALSWPALRLTFIAFLDCGLHALRFQALQGDERIPLVTPWRFMPGVALGLGM